MPGNPLQPGHSLLSPEASAGAEGAVAADACLRSDGLPTSLQLEHAVALLRQSGLPLPGGGMEPVAALQLLIDGLCALSETDALTGLANRRQLDAALLREIDRVARTGEAALLLIVDIDHFKPINDNYGHAVGDRVLCEVALRLRAHVRPMDLVARMGGEEFALVLPHCSPRFGGVIAHRLCKAVEAHPFELPDNDKLRVTVSVGGAFAPAYMRSSAEHWIERADHHLYQAKASGRNAVSLESPPMSTVTNEEKGMLLSALSPSGGTTATQGS